MNNFYLYFNIFTLINLTALFIILFFRKNNSITNKLLALIILVPGLNFINNILIQSGLIYDYPFSLFLFFGTAQLYAPLVYAYVIMMMGQKYKVVSFLNIVTFCVVLLDFYFGFEFFQMNSAEQTQYLNGLSTENYPVQMNIINGLFVIVMLAYFIVALVKIYKYSKAVKNFYSDIEKVKIKYIQHFTVLLTTLNIALTIAYGAFPTPAVEYFFIPLILNIIYIYIIYYAFRHSTIFTQSEYCNLVADVTPLEAFKNYEEPICKEIQEIKKSQGKTKYKLAEKEIDENYNKILKYFDEKKPYIDPAINLTKLSNDLNACSHNISVTINTRFDMNFFDLINSYRINEAKRALTEIEKTNLTIEAIGFDSGFNTKSAFYRAFKKHTLMTPTEYILSKNL